MNNASYLLENRSPGQEVSRASRWSRRSYCSLLLVGMSLTMVLAVSSESLINGYYGRYRGSFYAADSGVAAARQQVMNQLMNVSDGLYPAGCNPWRGQYADMVARRHNDVLTVTARTAATRRKQRELMAGAVLDEEPVRGELGDHTCSHVQCSGWSDDWWSEADVRESDANNIATGHGIRLQLSVHDDNCRANRKAPKWRQ